LVACANDNSVGSIHLKRAGEGSMKTFRWKLNRSNLVSRPKIGNERIYEAVSRSVTSRDTLAELRVEQRFDHWRAVGTRHHLHKDLGNRV
jgi:hypothetical protein